ncbi:MAG: hypothetical protein LBF15_03875 [Candidatus Peribacteria bacterium]|jgi:hypothetical protein|nr:hypothetical protein [Candidatus Peribacteria bacterium]
MQKTNKNASILIWAMFLSMIILVAFVSINNQILRNLNENSMITNNKDENIIYDAENYLKI